MEILKSFWATLKAVVSPLSAFLTGTALVCCGYASLNSTFGLRLNLSNTPMFLSGFILSCYYLGSITASVSAYKFINKVGNIRAFSAFTSLLSAFVLFHIFSENPFLLVLLRFGEGYCIGTINLCMESWLNTRATNKNRGLLMSLYMVTTYLGSGLGQLLLNLPDPMGVVPYVAVSVIFSVALVPISLTALPTPNITLVQKMSLKDLFKISPVGVVGCLCSGVFVGAFYTLGTIYAKQSGLDLAQTSLFMFAGIIGGMCAQIPLGRISDFFDRRFVMMWVCGAMFVIAPWIHLFIDNGTWQLMAAAFVLGACTFVVYPICVSHVNDQIGDDNRVKASGMLIMLQSVGMIVGPIIISFLMEWFGAISFLLSMSIIAGGFVLFAFHYIARRDVNYVANTPTQPLPAEQTPVFPSLASNDSIMDKAKNILAEKKH